MLGLILWAVRLDTVHLVRLGKPGNGQVLKREDPCSMHGSTLKEQDCNSELLAPRNRRLLTKV